MVAGFFNKSPSKAAASKGVSVTVSQGSKVLKQIDSDAPVNLRKLLLDNKVDLYKPLDKLKQCGGGGTCGTCRVRVTEGMENCSKKGLGEEKMLKAVGADIRLACCTRVTGPVSVTVKP
ncbi:hypothetical protein JKP88DRAFT_278211 [Tribonema minus]|uniref:2Fe-2S ferredoxin-type domain-containing protein n=1 Tax=Tribonema minus TaxID=303371 RepID=A0A835YVE2_9STRA|nr:hypothetical protein JKP88DRAFT_278211 [Tribonema minus]